MSVDPVSMGLMLGGKLLGGFADLKAAKKKNSLAAQNVQEQDRFAGQASQLVGQATRDIGASRPDIAGYTQQFAGALRGMPTVQGLPTAPQAFGQRAAAANSMNAADNGRLAQVFARVTAPAAQRQREGFRMAQLGNDTANLGAQAQARDFINQLRIGQVRANPLMKLGGDLLSNAGSSGIASGLFSAGPQAEKVMKKGTSFFTAQGGQAHA